MNLKFSKSLQVQVAGCRLQVAGYTCIYAGLQIAGRSLQVQLQVAVSLLIFIFSLINLIKE